MKKALTVLLVLSFVFALPAFAEKKKAETKPAPTIDQLMANGEYQKVIETGLKFIEKQQDTAPILYLMGLAYQQLKDNPNALSYYEKALAKAASDPLTPNTEIQLSSLINEANIYAEIKDDAKVSEIYEKALVISPENKDILLNYAICLEKRDKVKTYATYDKLVGIDPSFKNVAHEAGVFAIENKDYDKAESYLKTALQSLPSSEDNKMALAKLYLKKQNYEAAIPLLKDLSETTTRDILKPSFMTLLADSYYQTNKPMDAISTCDKILALRPNDDRALIIKTRAYRDMKDPKNAAAIAELVLAANPSHEEANYLRGKIAVEQQDFKKARLHFEKVLSITSDPERKTEVQGYLKQIKGGK